MGKRLELYSDDYCYKAYREKGELYLWSSLSIGRDGMLFALDDANITYGDMAGCFDKVPETCGPQVFFHFGA